MTELLLGRPTAVFFSACFFTEPLISHPTERPSQKYMRGLVISQVWKIDWYISPTPPIIFSKFSFSIAFQSPWYRNEETYLKRKTNSGSSDDLLHFNPLIAEKLQLTEVSEIRLWKFVVSSVIQLCIAQFWWKLIGCCIMLTRSVIYVSLSICLHSAYGRNKRDHYGPR